MLSKMPSLQALHELAHTTTAFLPCHPPTSRLFFHQGSDHFAITSATLTCTVVEPTKVSLDSLEGGKRSAVRKSWQANFGQWLLCSQAECPWTHYLISRSLSSFRCKMWTKITTPLLRGCYETSMTSFIWTRGLKASKTVKALKFYLPASKQVYLPQVQGGWHKIGNCWVRGEGLHYSPATAAARVTLIEPIPHAPTSTRWCKGLRILVYTVSCITGGETIA